MGEMKSCPHCGCDITLDEVKENIICRIVKARCQGCGMHFEHQQDFAYSTVARVALNDSFEATWNRRVGESNG